MESLDPRVRIIWGLTGLLGAIVVSLGVAIVDTFLFSIGQWLAVVAFVGIGSCVVPYTLLRYRVWQFEIRDDALHLERGVFTRVETAVPFVRVQHVDTQRGPVARLLGLASVVVYTAGSRGADVTIPGLRSERANALHNRLRELAIESEEDAV
ncbi:PH domain-containing protein [Halocatena salina]|uniref:PH domain-containing protein n=1 Tax=Halocatena salina TaxID=2934340 RepID=A0A8T9ZZ10_9EURY|nr:PH domain-containing protein [Halocatena salina]UPM41980.1 PH domain-containing protein [Halocatena salina]